MKASRRRTHRHYVRTKVVIVCDRGLTRLQAVLVNQNVTGVKVHLAEETRITGDCYLLFEHRMEPCRLVWQVSRSAGLAFAR